MQVIQVDSIQRVEFSLQTPLYYVRAFRSGEQVAQLLSHAYAQKRQSE